MELNKLGKYLFMLMMALFVVSCGDDDVDDVRVVQRNIVVDTLNISGFTFESTQYYDDRDGGMASLVLIRKDTIGIYSDGSEKLCGQGYIFSIKSESGKEQTRFTANASSVGVDAAGNFTSPATCYIFGKDGDSTKYESTISGKYDLSTKDLTVTVQAKQNGSDFMSFKFVSAKNTHTSVYAYSIDESWGTAHIASKMIDDYEDGAATLKITVNEITLTLNNGMKKSIVTQHLDFESKGKWGKVSSDSFSYIDNMISGGKGIATINGEEYDVEFSGTYNASDSNALVAFVIADYPGYGKLTITYKASK